jgi:hypothetical protein
MKVDQPNLRELVPLSPRRARDAGPLLIIFDDGGSLREAASEWVVSAGLVRRPAGTYPGISAGLPRVHGRRVADDLRCQDLR